MSGLTRASLANRGLVALVAVLVAAFGVLTIPQLKQQVFPSLDFPAAFVLASYPGAAPDVVERQVTSPIENSLPGITGLTDFSSTSRDSLATIQLEFDFGTNLDDAVQAVQTNLNRISAQLPSGVVPQVIAGSTDDFPVLILAASPSAGEDEKAFADALRAKALPAITAIDGVREADLTGARAQQIVITPDPAAFAAAGLSLAALPQALTTNGVVLPVGAITTGATTLTVQVGTPLSTLDDLRDLYLGTASGDAVRLGDVATVESQLAPVTSITRTNGQSSLGISVTATPDGNAVKISNEIKDLLPQLEQDLGGATLTPVFDQAPYVEDAIRGLSTEGLLGLVMAVLVILVFLLSIRSTLVTAVSIPLSVVAALIGLRYFDYSLNVLTLGALTIAVGRVVDDSIVVLENIKRHLSYGEPRHDAVLAGVREVAGAVTASTITTVAVFMPIALVGGLVGQLFLPFALTVTVALLASLLVALTVVPVLAYWFLRTTATAGGATDGGATAGGATGSEATGAGAAVTRAAAEAKELRSPLQRAYVPVIRFATTRRWLVVGLAILIFLGTGALAGLLKTNFFDQSGQTAISLTQTLPVGSSLSTVDEAAHKVEAVLAATPEVSTYQVTIGTGEGIFAIGGGGANVASFTATLRDGVDVLAVQDSLRSRTAALTDAGEIRVEAGQGGGFAANAISVIVQADDADTLAAASEQVRAAVASVPNVVDVASDLGTSTPRIEVAVDRAAAARAGLTEATIGQSLAAYFRGAPVGQLTIDGTPQLILLHVGAIDPSSVDDVRALPLPSATGVIRLDAVATVSTVDGPVQVTRVNGVRSVTVSGTATGDNLGATSTALRDALAALDLPAGASYTIGGASADQSDAFGQLGEALLAAIAIVFLVMAATFRSLVQPLILLVSIPFAGTGAIGLLLATDTPLGVPALIGMLMLVGIVVTNAIVLLDLINQYRARGLSVRDAVIEGGRRRVRPILMTAVATIFALTPMALGLTGSGGFISQPLAIVVIGGLVSSTVLTLVLVPTIYALVEDGRQRRRQRRVAPAADAAPQP